MSEKFPAKFIYICASTVGKFNLDEKLGREWTSFEREGELYDRKNLNKQGKRLTTMECIHFNISPMNNYEPFSNFLAVLPLLSLGPGFAQQASNHILTMLTYLLTSQLMLTA